MEQELNHVEQIDKSQKNGQNIEHKSSCKEALILNKSVIKEALKYGLIILILGYCIGDIVGIKTNKKEPSKEANIEFWVACSLTILSSTTLIYKINSYIQNMRKNTAIRNSKTPLERMFQDYNKGLIELPISGNRSKSTELPASLSKFEFDYSEL